jgi:hypothetical protein
MRRPNAIVLAVAVLVGAALAGGAAGLWRRHARSGLERFALAAVAAARSPEGLGAELVDEDLVERARRLQLVLRSTWDTHDRARLLGAFSGEALGPDRQYPPAERPLRQRERASRGLRDALDGKCRARRWEDARAARVAWLTTPPGGDWWPSEIATAQAELAGLLATAEAARVECDHGDVVLLVARRDGRRRLVDVFPTERSKLQLNPNDPRQR